MLSSFWLDFVSTGGLILIAVGVVKDADGGLVELVDFFFDTGRAQV